MKPGELGAELPGNDRSEVAGPAQTASPAMPAAAMPAEIAAATAIVETIDRLLAEPARRRHLFAWLKRPGGGSEDWLPVDAYYPRLRLVVVCQPSSAPFREQLAELIPAHGLRLLEVDPDQIPGDRDAARRELERRLEALEPSPLHAARSGTAGQPAQVPVARPDAGPGAVSVPTTATESERQMTGALIGLALTAVLFAELYFGVARAGFGSGQVLLAFALALDACARALGAVAAARVEALDWALWCVLGGSPAVAAFAFFRRTGPVSTEPAPLAGLVGMLALLMLVLAGLTNL